MIRRIGSRLVDYLFARDICASHNVYRNKISEAVLDKEQSDNILKDIRNFKITDVIFCSVIPNLIECAGIGLSIYNQSLSFAVIGGLVGESFRQDVRSASKYRLKSNNNLWYSNIRKIDDADRTGVNVKDFGDEFDEGEEWKKA